MFGFGFTELVLILIVLLFFLGGKRFPQIGDGLGRGITEFKKAIRGSSAPSSEASHKLTKEKREGGGSTS